MTQGVSSGVCSIIESFANGLEVLSKLDDRHKRKKERSSRARRDEHALQLSRSLRQGPQDISREYERGMHGFGERYAHGDGIAQSCLSEIVLKLNTGLVGIIANFLDHDKRSPTVDYGSLTKLSETSRCSSLDVLRHLYQRMSSQCLTAPPSSSHRPVRSKQTTEQERQRRTRGSSAARVTIEDSSRRPQLAVIKPGVKRKLHSSSSSNLSKVASHSSHDLTKPASYSSANSSKPGSYSSVNSSKPGSYSSVNPSKPASYCSANSSKPTSYSSVNSTKPASYSSSNLVKPASHSSSNLIKPASYSSSNLTKATSRSSSTTALDSMRSARRTSPRSPSSRSPLIKEPSMSNMQIETKGPRPAARSSPGLLPTYSQSNDRHLHPAVPYQSTQALRKPLDQPRRKDTPTMYSIATDSTKLGEIPLHRWAVPYDFDAMSTLNREAMQSGWPLTDLNGSVVFKPKKRFGLFRMFKKKDVSA